jgi:hypothetical protein
MITSTSTSSSTRTGTGTIVIDCDDCVMQATPACADCVVSHMCGTAEHSAVVLDLAEQRAVRLFADAGMVPTLRHRAAANA